MVVFKENHNKTDQYVPFEVIKIYRAYVIRNYNKNNSRYTPIFGATSFFGSNLYGRMLDYRLYIFTIAQIRCYAITGSYYFSYDLDLYTNRK